MGLKPCADQQSPAICQGGYYVNAYFLNFGNWDEFQPVPVRSYSCNGDCGYYVVGYVVPKLTCQAPFLCQKKNPIGPPPNNPPETPSSPFSKYIAFLGCEVNSVTETITDEENDPTKTAYGFMNAGALLAIRFKQANVIGITFVATAGAMDVGAMAKANMECTDQIYH
jgi:hypothetical protein